jgi:hypothetical protein
MRSHRVWNAAHPGDMVRAGYQIHHINGVRDDDRPENLQKVTIAEHYALHKALGSHIGTGTGPRKTECVRGHSYELYRSWSPSGDSWCRECGRLKMQKARATPQR